MTITNYMRRIIAKFSAQDIPRTYDEFPDIKLNNKLECVILNTLKNIPLDLSITKNKYKISLDSDPNITTAQKKKYELQDIKNKIYIDNTNYEFKLTIGKMPNIKIKNKNGNLFSNTKIFSYSIKKNGNRISAFCSDEIDGQPCKITYDENFKISTIKNKWDKKHNKDDQKLNKWINELYSIYEKQGHGKITETVNDIEKFKKLNDRGTGYTRKDFDEGISEDYSKLNTDQMLMYILNNQFNKKSFNGKSNNQKIIIINPIPTEELENNGSNISQLSDSFIEGQYEFQSRINYLTMNINGYNGIYSNKRLISYDISVTNKSTNEQVPIKGRISTILTDYIGGESSEAIFTKITKNNISKARGTIHDEKSTKHPYVKFRRALIEGLYEKTIFGNITQNTLRKISNRIEITNERILYGEKKDRTKYNN